MVAATVPATRTTIFVASMKLDAKQMRTVCLACIVKQMWPNLSVQI